MTVCVSLNKEIRSCGVTMVCSYYTATQQLFLIRALTVCLTVARRRKLDFKIFFKFNSKQKQGLVLIFSLGVKMVRSHLLTLLLITTTRADSGFAEN
jgi:hypothetical protein